MKGTLVIDERICRVVDIQISDGAFWIEAIGRGPWFMHGDTDYQLHGSDGRLIVQSRSGPLEIDAEDGDIVSVRVEVRVDGPNKVGRPV